MIVLNPPDNVFGVDVFYNQDLSETFTNSATIWSNKLTLSTLDLTPGDYLISFQFSWRASNNSRSIDVRLLRNSIEIESFNLFTSSTDDSPLISGFIRQASISGFQDIDLQFKRGPSNTTVFMSRSRLFVWRIA
jgi:hypothetical protein